MGARGTAQAAGFGLEFLQPEEELEGAQQQDRSVKQQGWMPRRIVELAQNTLLLCGQ